MILKSPNAFDEDFIPNTVIGREKEISEISFSIKPLFSKLRGANLFIYGRPGVGKTLCVRHILEKISESSKVRTAYVNCWSHRSRPSIIYEILTAVGGFTPRRGISPDEMIDELNRSLSESWGAVIALDEIDKTEDMEVLYDLLRTIKHNIVIIGMSNLNSFQMDDRILSAYTPKKMEFVPYSVQDLKKILAERAKDAFVPGACSEDIIGMCAAVGYNSGGDARVALKTLFNSAVEAQAKDMLAITPELVQKVKEGMSCQRHSADELEGLDKKLYELVSQSKDGIESGEIYKKVKDVTERTVRNALTRLMDKNMVARIKSKTGSSYNYVITETGKPKQEKLL